MEEMLRFGFWNIVFDIPSVSDFKDKELIEKVPALGFALMQLGMQSLQQNCLKTEKTLLVDPEVKDKRQRYSQEELQVLIFLSLLTLPYQGYQVPDGKKWVGLAEHIVVTELKYSSKIAKFVQRTGELVAQLQTLLAEGHQTPFQVRVVKWLRNSE